MSEDILLRLGWVVLLALGGTALYTAFSRLSLRRLRRSEAEVPLSAVVPPGKPSLVYFTSPTCAPCRTYQRPVIERLQAQLGERLQVVEIDASSETEIADRWGVMSVPTTFLFDTQGQPRFVNHGVTPLEKLFRQVEQLD
jgi:thiol-disulfide isomerase/thioredoxin